jgi:hypothetical protein
VPGKLDKLKKIEYIILWDFKGHLEEMSLKPI